LTSTKWQPPRPSVFTPFLRRFTDEKARDVAETRALYKDVTARHRASKWSREDIIEDFAEVLFADIQVPVPEVLGVPVFELLVELLKLEKPIFSTPPNDPDLGALSLKGLVDLRRFLRAQEHFLDHEDATIDTLAGELLGILDGVMGELPTLDSPSPFTIPLICVLPNPQLIVEKIGGTLLHEKALDLGLFAEINEQRELNLCEAYGIVPGAEIRKVLKPISEMDWSPQEAVKAVMKRTPFHDFLMTPVPLKFDHETRYSHVHVVGGSGAGKTQLLQSLILNDLQSEQPPALIIVDSQSDLISKISRLDVFHPDHGELRGKLTIITPRDIDYPPAINIFDINKGRIGSYGAAMREQVVAGVIQTFDYLFAGLLGADLTAKQSVFFRFVARLMLVLPETMGRNATILDMMNLMDDIGPYRDAIRTLPSIQRNFFERDFNNSGFRQTKEQIRYRLQAILENPTLERLFTSTRTKIDLFAEINNGGIILIDTAKDFLKDGSAHFGRIFISLVLQAALERAAIPEHKRRPAFLVVDEAADYFDDNIDDLLTQVRKYKMGCLFAHQFMDQCSSTLRASLAANTSTKLCSALSMSDARSFAADMRTTPDQILSQKKLHFSCYVRNVTPEAVSIPVQAGRMERQPRMSDDAYDDLRAANFYKVSTALDPVEEPDGNDDAKPGQGDPVEDYPAPRARAPTPASKRTPHQAAPRASKPIKPKAGPDTPGPVKSKAEPKAPKPATPLSDPNDPATEW
jgi:hypothetical protein